MNEHMSSWWENPWAPKYSFPWDSFVSGKDVYTTVIGTKVRHHRGPDNSRISIFTLPPLIHVVSTLFPGLNHHNFVLEVLIPGSSNLVCGSEDGLWETLALRLALTFEIQLSEPPMLRQNHVQVIDPVIIIPLCWQDPVLWSDQWWRDCRASLVFKR